MNSVTLESLVGEHMLDAVDDVDQGTLALLASLIDPNDEYDKREQLEKASMLMFRLDGRCYLVMEDPSDGYRSCMKDIFDMGPGPMTNVFPPCRVVTRMGDDGGRYNFPEKDEFDGNEKNEILDFYDRDTQLPVLSVGTSNSLDYYPSYVADFRPANMKVNQGK